MKPLKQLITCHNQCVSGKYNNAGYLFYETKEVFILEVLSHCWQWGQLSGLLDLTDKGIIKHK